MSGSWQVTERPATPAELAGIDAPLRESVATGSSYVAGMTRCGRAAGGCAVAVVAIPLAALLARAQPTLTWVAVSGAMLAIVASITIYGRQFRYLGEQKIESLRVCLAYREAGVRWPETVAVLEAEIAGSVLVNFDARWGHHYLILDFGGELGVVDPSAHSHWPWFVRQHPFHRRFRMVLHGGSILSYEALTDEQVPHRVEELAGEGCRSRAALAALSQGLREQSETWGPRQDLHRIPGTLATWRADLLRATAQAGPRSLSQAEADDDGGRG